MKYQNILATALAGGLYLASPNYAENKAYAGTPSRVNATRISQSILDHDDSKK